MRHPLLCYICRCVRASHSSHSLFCSDALLLFVMVSQIQIRSPDRAAWPPVIDFDSIIVLSYSVLTDEQNIEYLQIQDFCCFLGLLVKGVRRDKRRIFEFKPKLDTDAAILLSVLPSYSRVSFAGKASEMCQHPSGATDGGEAFFEQHNCTRVSYCVVAAL